MMLCGPRSTTPRLSAYFALLFSTCLPILDLVDGTIDLGRVLGFLWNDCTGTFCKDGTRHALLSILLANQERPCIAVALPFSADEDKIEGSAIV